MSGLIKLIHITTKTVGSTVSTNAIETAYFQFPEAAFEATQRKTGGKLPIKVVEELLASLGYNRAQGFTQDAVNENLDKKQANGLRKWENIVTGTDENQLLLSTAAEVEGGLTLNIALTETGKQGRVDTGYHVRYDLRKYDDGDGGWKSVGEIKDSPNFSIQLLDEANKSVGATGFYRLTTLIIPDNELSVTNEIPSTNIVGVLEVASTLTNTLAAVPWVALATDPDSAKVQSMKVSGYVNTSHLENGDSVQVATDGLIYRGWSWDQSLKQWIGASTVTASGVFDAFSAEEQPLYRNSAVWVSREKPETKPFFLVGQYSGTPVYLTIKGGTAAAPVCTLVPNPSIKAMKVNDYDWNEYPADGDIIRIPNGKSVPVVLRWKDGAWGRYVYDPQTYMSEWRTDATVPAGTGFWYHRCAGGFSLELKLDVVPVKD